MPSNKVFRSVQMLRPGRSVFDLSYSKKMSGKMGYLYPMMCDEVVPGDVFDISAEAVIRFAPMVAPVLHEILLKADWFFVPYRICDGVEDLTSVDGKSVWEQFITAGQEGDNVIPLHRIDVTPAVATEGGLLDNLGIPPGLTLTDVDRPISYPVRAYNFIYNEYYRDPNLEDMVDLDDLNLLTGNWEADYFTRSLPWQQRGGTVALPIVGTAHAEWNASLFLQEDAATATGFSTGAGDNHLLVGNNANAVANANRFMNANDIDLSTASSISISDLRLAVQLQRWGERNARAGYRYTEFLRAHFGVAPRDDRLDRPEYIGGLRQPIIVSEVLQTSATDTGVTPQGNMAGHGILAGRSRIGRYHVQEYGLIMCLMSVVPRTAYQQGINKQWLRVSRYQFYHPEFANLSEEAVLKEEIYADNSTAGTNQGIFGYIGRYDEMRSKQDLVAGAFRSSLDYWHLGRQFASLPALNSTFGHVDPSACTRIFAVPEADNMYIHWGNAIRAIRPLPPQSNPGRMDHDYGGY